MESESKNLADAIEKLGERIVTAKEAELSHLREINATLTGIQTYLKQVADVLYEKKQS